MDPSLGDDDGFAEDCCWGDSTEGWSSKKKSWCCENYQKGCSTYDCYLAIITPTSVNDFFGGVGIRKSTPRVLGWLAITKSGWLDGLFFASFWVVKTCQDFEVIICKTKWMITGAMPSEPIAVSKRRKVVQVGAGADLWNIAFWGLFFVAFATPFGTGYDSSAHFDCAEDYGDWQSKWTDESWLHFCVSPVWLHFSSRPVSPIVTWNVEAKKAWCCDTHVPRFVDDFAIFSIQWLKESNMSIKYTPQD